MRASYQYGQFEDLTFAEVRKITDKMKIAAAKALASFVKGPNPEKIIPSVFEEGIAQAVAEAVKAFAS